MALVLVGHAGQILQVDMNKAGLVGLDAALFALGRRHGVVQGRQPSVAVAFEHAMDAGAQDLFVDEFVAEGGEIVEAEAELLRISTRTASWTGVRVVWSRWGRWEPSRTVSRLRQRLTVMGLRP